MRYICMTCRQAEAFSEQGYCQRCGKPDLRVQNKFGLSTANLPDPLLREAEALRTEADLNGGHVPEARRAASFKRFPQTAAPRQQVPGVVADPPSPQWVFPENPFARFNLPRLPATAAWLFFTDVILFLLIKVSESDNWLGYAGIFALLAHLCAGLWVRKPGVAVASVVLLLAAAWAVVGAGIAVGMGLCSEEYMPDHYAGSAREAFCDKGGADLWGQLLFVPILIAGLGSAVALGRKSSWKWMGLTALVTAAGVVGVWWPLYTY